ncbi:MAG: tubulin-like doman-containing protein [Defluviitaleaceae bacterium]|nr:tubulin-like doman-containing protein [Defluviitaleaceae bacterium]MCL2240182.1 tubulin-like doman-containing protein [Defluviitaleaceae bacterium]
MKKNIFNHIRQLDLSLGGGLVSDPIRIDTINHPILIIGLGGTGVDALLRVKAQVHRHFAKGGQKPANIEYLAFETNEHDKKRYDGMGLEGHELVLLSNAGIGAILGNRSTLPGYISAWLAPELSISDGTKGASGNRQAGRLLLFEKINGAIDAIDGKIRALRVERENKLLVFILTGLSGGTGGGMFLDVAYIVRGLMERDYGAKGIDRVETSGYLFTPDVHIAGNALNIHTEEYIQRNGYAALKELDYWMNVEERAPERFVQRYGTRLTVNSGLPPFNLCHLVSATNIDGVYLKDAYAHCLDVTAENIVNFLAQEEKTSGQEFAIHDYQSNLLANIAAMKSGLPTGADHSANYIYNVIGAAAAVLPTTQMNTYLAHCVFTAMDEMFDAMPEENELKAFIRHAGLETDALMADLGRALPPLQLDYAGTDFYSYQNVIKNRRVDVDAKLNEGYGHIKAALGEHKKEYTPLLEGAKAALREVFLHPRQGPVFATRLIESTTNPCLLPWLETCIAHLQEKQQRCAGEMEAHDIAAANAFEGAQKALLFTREGKKNAFIAAKVRAYQARVRKDCFGYIAEVYKAVHAALEGENDRVFAPIAQALQEVKKVLAKNDAQGYGGTGYGWRVAEVAEAAKDAQARIKEWGAEALTKQFTKSLLDNAPRWLDAETPDIVGALSDFIYAQFGTTVSRSLDDYLTEEDIEARIAPRLHRDALPVFHLDNAAGLYHFPSYGMVSVPNNAPGVLRGIEKHRDNALSGLKFNIRRSKITDRIFWLNTLNGVPLFAYTPLRVYEALYERTINGKEGVGRHFWHHLPSPLPESLWGDTYVNERQKAANHRARGIFADGLALGSIAAREEHANSRYVAIAREDFDAEPYAANETTPPHTLHELTLRLRALQSGGGPPITEKRPLFNSPTPELALAHFLRNPPLIALVHAENEKHKKIAATLAALVALQAAREEEKSTTDDFITALACEALIKQNGHYLYAHAPEEDKWPPLVNLLTHPEHPEQALFTAYKTLPADKKERLKRRAGHNRDKLPEGRLLTNLRKWQGIFTLRKDALENDGNPPGTAAHGFYRDMLLRTNTHIAAWV